MDLAARLEYDEIFFLGHDMTGGYFFEQEKVASAELVRRFQWAKRIGIRFDDVSPEPPPGDVAVEEKAEHFAGQMGLHLFIPSFCEFNGILCRNVETGKMIGTMQTVPLKGLLESATKYG